MKIGFVTCVELGMACLEEIERLDGRLETIVTLRDDIALKKSGRIFVDDYARRTGTPVIKIRNINDADCVRHLRAAELDYLLVIGWSQIVHDEALATIGRGVFGMHPTLLPVGRGRAPIPWTILKGLKETGVTAFEIAFRRRQWRHRRSGSFSSCSATKQPQRSMPNLLWRTGR